MLRSCNGAIGHKTATCEDGRGMFLDGKIKEGIGASAPGLGHKIAFQHQGGIERNTSLFQRIAVALVAVVRDLVLEWPLDMSDTAMPKANQVTRGFVGTQAVIN